MMDSIRKIFLENRGSGGPRLNQRQLAICLPHYRNDLHALPDVIFRKVLLFCGFSAVSPFG